MPMIGSQTRCADLAQPAQCDRPDRRARHPRPAAEPRPAGRRGSSAMPRSVLISEKGVGAVRLGGGGDGGRRGGVGRELDDQRLVGQRAHRVEHAGELAGSAPMTGRSRRSGRDVELERGDLVALGERGDEPRDLLAREA